MATPDGAPSRLGFDAIRALHNETGLGNYARLLLEGLAAVAPERERLLYSPRPPRGERAVPLGGTLRLPPPGWRLPGARNLWRTFRLGRVAARDGVELYHGLTQEIPRDLPETGIRSVLSVPDLLYVTHPHLFPAIDQRSYLWRYRWSIEHADAIIAISEGTRVDLEHHFGVPPSKITVLPPAVSPRFTAPPPSPETVSVVRTRWGLPSRYLVVVGTLEPRKNQQLAIRALAERPDSGLHLALIGRDRGSGDRLREVAERCHVADRVHLLTTVGTEDLVALLAGATVASYLSEAEGFGMPIVEAQAMGLPVVATRGGHLEDAGGAAARYISREDPAALATAWEQMAAPGPERERVIAESRLHAATFDRTALATRLLAIYDAVYRAESLPKTLPAR